MTRSMTAAVVGADAGARSSSSRELVSFMVSSFQGIMPSEGRNYARLEHATSRRRSASNLATCARSGATDKEAMRSNPIVLLEPREVTIDF